MSVSSATPRRTEGQNWIGESRRHRWISLVIVVVAVCLVAGSVPTAVAATDRPTLVGVDLAGTGDTAPVIPEERTGSPDDGPIAAQQQAEPDRDFWWYVSALLNWLVPLLSPLLLLVLAYLVYRDRDRIRAWLAERLESSNGDPIDDPSWRDLVVEGVVEKPHHKRLLVRNASDRTWDLSGATVTDATGEEFTVGTGYEIGPGEVAEIRVPDRLDFTPGTRVPLRTGSSERYELTWRSSLDAHPSDR